MAPERNGKDGELAAFLRHWLRSPRTIGAIAPSSRRLARAMVDLIDRSRPGVVVELGAGTGPITAALIESGLPPSEIVSIEREAGLCAMLRARFPEIRVLEGDARSLPDLAKAAGIGPVRDVISGLPLLSFPPELRREIVAAAFSLLPAEGRYIQFTYGPSARVPHALAAELGLVARRDRWVLGNLPPAAVWVYARA